MIQRDGSLWLRAERDNRSPLRNQWGRGRSRCQLPAEALQRGAQREADTYQEPPGSRWSAYLCADHIYVFPPLTFATPFWVSDITDSPLKMGKQRCPVARKLLHWGSPDKAWFQSFFPFHSSDTDGRKPWWPSALWPLGFRPFLAFSELCGGKLGLEEMGSAENGSRRVWGVIPLGGEAWQDLLFIREKRWQNTFKVS